MNQSEVVCLLPEVYMSSVQAATSTVSDHLVYTIYTIYTLYIYTCMFTQVMTV